MEINRPQVPSATIRSSFFLDVDGTLLEIAEHPDAVQVGPGLVTTLQSLQRTNAGAVALISGRELADLDRIFAPHRFAAAGQHGFERRSAAGEVLRHNIASERLDTARQRLRDFVAANAGAFLEDKGMTVALHYRQAPAVAAAAEQLVEDLVADLGPSYKILRGKMIVEIKPEGIDKGTAIRAFMIEAPFAGTMPVFIGDDVTDEDGFEFVNKLGGLSIRVGDTGPSAATRRLSDSTTVLTWLTQCANTLARG